MIKATIGSRKSRQPAPGSGRPPASDRRLNQFGAFEFGFEEIVVPHRDKKSSTVVCVAEAGDADGSWLGSYSAERRWGSAGLTRAGESLSLKSARCVSRTSALAGQLEKALKFWGDQHALHFDSITNKRLAARALEDVEKFLEAVGDDPEAGTERKDDGKAESGKRKADAGRALDEFNESLREEATGTAAAEELVFLEVDLAQIDVSRNPRKFFDPKKIEALAASIEKHGLQQKPIVRVLHGNLGKPRYDLIGGGRRLKALELLGRKTVGVGVRELSDAEADELRGVLNLDAESFTPLEEAAWLQEQVAKYGKTQAELARGIGKDPSWVSNRIRLLELPEWWQQRVVSQEILPTHAREVLRYKDHPTILQRLEKQVASWIKSGVNHRGGDRPAEMSVSDFADEIACEARHVCESLDGNEWLSSIGSVRWTLAPTAEEARQLGLVEIEGAKWATNRKLAAKLLQRARQEAIDAATAKKSKGSKSAPAAKGAAPKKAPTPAQLAARKKERAAQLARHLQALRVDWLRMLCSRALRARVESDGLAAQKLLLWLATYGGNEAARSIRYALEDVEVGRRDMWEDVAPLNARDFDAALREVVAATLWSVESDAARQDVASDVVEGLARLLKLDLADAWRVEKCGPLTERYFDIRTKDELLLFGKSVGQHLEPGQSKETMCKILADRRYAMPTELALPKAESGKRKAAAKRRR